MSDGFEDPTCDLEPEPAAPVAAELTQAQRRAQLSYPWDEAPEAGAAVEVAPGVLWLRLRLPFALEFINVWALADGDGWTLVDTGISSRETAAAWRAAFAGPLGGKPVKRVIVTHMHPDHVGMAGWLLRKFDCRLWMTRLEYVTCRMLIADTGREAPKDGERFYHAAGWDEEAIEHYRARFGGFGKGVHAMPDSYHRIGEGDLIRVGAHDWRVVTGSGHSPEHASLYCAELKLLISGDQVLPRISSNVSVHPTEPDADPLGDWLASLEHVRAEVPDEVLVLPSHGLPFHGLHARVDALIAGHETGLKRLRRSLAEAPKRSIDVFGALFARKIDGGLLGMATGESLAHLNHLRATGAATAEADEGGVVWWRAA